MLKWLRKDPSKKLVKDYEAKLSEAMQAQRNGDIKSYSMLSQEAEEIYQKIQSLMNQKTA